MKKNTKIVNMFEDFRAYQMPSKNVIKRVFAWKFMQLRMKLVIKLWPLDKDTISKFVKDEYISHSNMTKMLDYLEGRQYRTEKGMPDWFVGYTKEKWKDNVDKKLYDDYQRKLAESEVERAKNPPPQEEQVPYNG